MSKQAATAGISAREAEILTLVGEHRSNAEIGAQLFISVRTVEAHVSSLLRKLGAPDRRALADLARAERTSQARAGLPAPLNPFIGRAEERSVLRDAVSARREVTAVGPGGVGKTRLALAVAADLAGDFADGVWFAILDQLGVTPEDRAGYSPTFDAITLLHHGQNKLALERLGPQTDEPNAWRTGILLHWHVALRAEAAVLAGSPDATDHLAAARPIVAGNPTAGAILDRAVALLDDDHERILDTATAFETAGCPYQRARTLILAGRDTAPAGRAALADLGI